MSIMKYIRRNPAVSGTNRLAYILRFVELINL